MQIGRVLIEIRRLFGNIHGIGDRLVDTNVRQVHAETDYYPSCNIHDVHCYTCKQSRQFTPPHASYLVMDTANDILRFKKYRRIRHGWRDSRENTRVLPQHIQPVLCGRNSDVHNSDI